MGELSPHEIEHDNPEIRRTRRALPLPRLIHNRHVDPGDMVTVIRFSAIKPTYGF